MGRAVRGAPVTVGLSVGLCRGTLCMFEKPVSDLPTKNTRDIIMHATREEINNGAGETGV